MNSWQLTTFCYTGRFSSPTCLGCDLLAPVALSGFGIRKANVARAVALSDRFSAFACQRLSLMEFWGICSMRQVLQDIEQPRLQAAEDR